MYKCDQCSEECKIVGNQAIEPEYETPFIELYVECPECGYTIVKDTADRNRLLVVAKGTLAKFRLMYEKIEEGYDAEDLYTDSKAWPLTSLREAITDAEIVE